MLSGSTNDTSCNYGALNDVDIVLHDDLKHIPPHTVARKATFPTIINIMLLKYLDIISRINLIKTAKCFRDDYKIFEASADYKTTLHNDQLLFQKEGKRLNSELSKLEELRDQAMTEAQSKARCRPKFQTIEQKLLTLTLRQSYCYFVSANGLIGTVMGCVIGFIPSLFGCKFGNLCIGSIVLGGASATGCAIGTIGTCACLYCASNELSKIVDLNKQEMIIKRDMQNNYRFYEFTASKLFTTSLISSTRSAAHASATDLALPPPPLFYSSISLLPPPASRVDAVGAATADILAVPSPAIPARR